MSLLYLTVLWRFVLACAVRAEGRRNGPVDTAILHGGLPARLFLAGFVLVEVALHRSSINLWATIGGFLSYRVVLGAQQFLAMIAGSKEPIAPAIGWDSQDDPFISRERSSIGRTRRWGKGR